MNKYEKDTYINSEFVKKIQNYSLDNFDSQVEILENFIHFVVSSNSNYVYNKTYFRSFYTPYKHFIENLKNRMIFIKEFIMVLCSFLKENETAGISIDEYIFYDELKHDIDFENVSVRFAKTIPDVLLLNNSIKVYIDCKMVNQDEEMTYCYVETVNLYEEKGQIANIAKQFYGKLRGINDENIRVPKK